MALLYCWWIWRARNDFIFNEKIWATDAVSRKAQGDFYEFKDANIRVPHPPSSLSPLGTLVWQRLERNVLKINFDAAVCRSSSTIGTGAVARRDDGRVIGIFLALHAGINSSRITEALAIRDGLNLGIALKCPKVLIESDAEAIVRKCNDGQDPPSDIAVVIHDCLVLKNSFNSCDFGFVKRDCNRAAHCCAQKTLSNGMCNLWKSILLPWGLHLFDV
ncbi:uncharacterized protein LOC131322563 [Rhododendron vialii]|uniref:uncharacterized protein LOC131322563 n=1 Tax=Rhododendron vialii TaxID=182163 RepID=UPI00265F57B8|nr:uncharacterized protein LOC131322563 [Rhododendron vialii]